MRPHGSNAEDSLGEDFLLDLQAGLKNFRIAQVRIDERYVRKRVSITAEYLIGREAARKHDCLLVGGEVRIEGNGN
jgi:hypothetical protein